MPESRLGVKGELPTVTTYRKASACPLREEAAALCSVDTLAAVTKCAEQKKLKSEHNREPTSYCHSVRGFDN